jgi:hypothetical protein
VKQPIVKWLVPTGDVDSDTGKPVMARKDGTVVGPVLGANDQVWIIIQGSDGHFHRLKMEDIRPI